jgi:hypothetical protein
MTISLSLYPLIHRESRPRALEKGWGKVVKTVSIEEQSRFPLFCLLFAPGLEADVTSTNVNPPSWIFLCLPTCLAC